VFFSSGSTVLINLTLDISLSLIGCARNSHEHFKRWVSPPPNPPPMTDG
jgi:hypothetical protein